MHRFGTPILGSTYLLTFSHFRNCNSCQLQSLIETTFGNDGYTPLIAYRIMSNTLNYKLTSIVQLLLTKRIVHHIHNEFVALCTCAVSLVILVSVVLFSIENKKCTNNYWQSVFFFRALRGGKFPPLSFKIPPPPQTMTNFVLFFHVFHIFSPHESNFPPKTTFLEKTLLAVQIIL